MSKFQGVDKIDRPYQTRYRPDPDGSSPVGEDCSNYSSLGYYGYPGDGQKFVRRPCQADGCDGTTAVLGDGPTLCNKHSMELWGLRIGEVSNFTVCGKKLQAVTEKWVGRTHKFVE